MPAFLRLPVEVHGDIIQHLDPISLINLSKVSVYFRTLINPGRKERLEQLLALECLEEFGGAVAVHGRHHAYERMSGESEIRAWQKHRWACSSCLKLLPHNLFGNKAIFLAPQRKPHPRFVRKSPQTSWPSKTVFARGLLRRAPPPPSENEGEEELQDDDGGENAAIVGGGENAAIVGGGENSANVGGGESSADAGREDGDDSDAEYAKDYEPEYENEDSSTGDSYMNREDVGEFRQYWGHDRQNRKCIPCLYGNNPPQPKGYAWTLGDDKYTIVTIPCIRTRSVNFVSILDRYFPGFLDTLAVDGEAPQSERIKTYRHTTEWDDSPYGMALVQCPACNAWKEVRSFQIPGVPWHGNRGLQSEADKQRALYLRLMILEAHKDETRCTVCFVKEFGREALGRALVPWFHAHVDWELNEEVERMRCGWAVFPDMMNTNQRGVPRGLRKKMKPIMKELHDLFNGWFYRLDLTPALAAKLRDVYARILPFAIELKKAYERDELVVRWQYPWWVDGYLQMDEQWTWLKSTKAMVVENPDLLIDWALEMDSHPFNVLHKPKKASS